MANSLLGLLLERVERRRGLAVGRADQQEPEVGLLSSLIGAAERGDFGPFPPTHVMRRPPNLATYRLRLLPLEHHALSCLLVIGCAREGNPLVDCVCDQLGCSDRSHRARSTMVRRADDLGMLRGERIVGMSDVDLAIAQVLIEPTCQSAELAMQGTMPFVFPRFRPKRHHLQELCNALSNRELRRRSL